MAPATRVAGTTSFRHTVGRRIVRHRWRVVTSAVVAAVLGAGAAGTTRAAVQIVELSAQRVVPGTVVTMRIAITAREAGTEPGALFMIPSGTFGDSPESLHCEDVGRAVKVGQTHWEAGTVEYQGTSYPGFAGEATFTVPELPVDTYRLAESIDALGTGCHVFTSIEVVAELPDTAIAPAGATDMRAQDATAPITKVGPAFQQPPAAAESVLVAAAVALLPAVMLIAVVIGFRRFAT